ncbi:hypothetical protein [Mycobacterium mantenii]|uniref:hypothetical protein n=1 Tax=Mycobacterium mantenii TaxID=560555 RepID=UPI001041F8CF|nr:hypothetical protein [Mycobacterium mantenii]
MRGLGAIDGELQLIAGAWHVGRESGHDAPNNEVVDQLLDERAAVAGGTNAISPDIIHVASRR